jgi:hypothetical protein
MEEAKELSTSSQQLPPGSVRHGLAFLIPT